MSELGTRLKQARIEKGYDLEELQEITKIQKHYLAGIEKGDHRTLPGPFYVRAFIKQYANAVGLDARSLLDEYKSEVPVPTNEEVSSPLVAPISLSRQTFAKSSVNRLGEIMPKITVALFMIVVLLILVFFYSKHASNEPLEEDIAGKAGVRYEEPADSGAASQVAEAEEQQQPVQEPTEKTSLKLVSTEGEDTVYSWTGPAARKLKIEAAGRSWVSVTDAAQQELMSPVREMQAKDSETIDVSGLSRVRIRIDATPNVTLQLNGEPIEYTQDRLTQNIIVEFADS